MQIVQFKQWLKDEKIFTTDKQLCDCISRLQKIERAFLEFGVSIDEEFEKNQCDMLLQVLAREGQNPEARRFAGIDLPLKFDAEYPIKAADRRCGMFNNALKKYVLFRAVDGGYCLDELASRQPYMRLIIRNYLRKNNASE